MARARGAKVPRRTAGGETSTHSPKMSPRLAVTEPTALPTARSAFPWSTPRADTVISGSVVAKDTTVAPTRNRGTPQVSARSTDASTKSPPPRIITRRPTRKSPAAATVSMPFPPRFSLGEMVCPGGHK